MDELFIDTNGDYLVDQKIEKLKRQTNDGSQIFKTSETIDIVQGVNSDAPKRANRT